jgi:quercetin dioxygenase-like cupin family protein
MSASDPIVRPQGEGERRWFCGGGTHTWKVTADETGGSFLLFEDHLSHGKMTPLHRHAEIDETLYVLEGEVEIEIDGHRHRLGPGGVTVCPRGTPHAFAVTSDGARLLFLQTPGTAQPFYWNASVPATDDGPGPVDFDRVLQVAKEHGGTEMLGPPPFVSS